MDGKTKAIVAHLYWIGWIIALVLNQNENKDELASFYIRQLLGIFLFSLACSILIIIPPIAFLGWLAALVFWIMSIIGAINGKKKEVPWIGKYFQDWFKAL